MKSSVTFSVENELVVAGSFKDNIATKDFFCPFKQNLLWEVLQLFLLVLCYIMTMINYICVLQ